MDLKPYQQILLDKLSNGFKPGEMTIITSSRQTGKSLINQYLQQWHSMDYDTELKPRYKITSIEPAKIDGELWHTIRCNNEISKWIRSQASGSWYEHPSHTWYSFFDVCEDLYMLMILKFGK